MPYSEYVALLHSPYTGCQKGSTAIDFEGNLCMNFGNEIPGGFKCLKQKYLLHQGELRMTTLEEVKCQPQV